MSASFDPYFKWLGIAPKDQPPSHYRLLGIDVFLSDRDVIANAADRQMMLVRTFQSGEHSAISQQILNEISAAKLCLLQSESKATYDGQLRAKINQGEVQLTRPPQPVGQSDSADKATPPLPTKTPTKTQTKRPSPRPMPMPPAATATAPVIVPAKEHPYQARGRSSRAPWITVALCGGVAALFLLLLGGIIGLGYLLVSNDDDATKGEPNSARIVKVPVSEKVKKIEWVEAGQRDWIYSSNKTTIQVTDDVQNNTWLLSKRSFGDFVLTGQFRIDAEKGQGGIYARVPFDPQWPWSEGLEVHLMNDYGKGTSFVRNRTGSIFDRAEPWTGQSNPRGQWNDVKIECRARNVKVWINNQQVNDFDLPQAVPLSGRIGLDGVSGGITYRQIEVEPLK